MFKRNEDDKNEVILKEFLDTISPYIIKFYTDYYILGNTYRSFWAIRSYPASTNELTLLRYIDEKENVTLKIYTRLVTPIDERKIIANATNKTKMIKSSATQVSDTITAQADIEDLTVMMLICIEIVNH